MSDDKPKVDWNAVNQAIKDWNSDPRNPDSLAAFEKEIEGHPLRKLLNRKPKGSP